MSSVTSTWGRVGSGSVEDLEHEKKVPKVLRVTKVLKVCICKCVLDQIFIVHDNPLESKQIGYMNTF